ncbi:MAG: hypothetical protein JZU53_07120 [Paludibacter sp.]|nr:hypothetical protein [Paludibacter sp.]
MNISENEEWTSGQLANRMKQSGKRRVPSVQWDKYAEMLGMKKENRMPKMGGVYCYHWNKLYIDRLIKLLDNGIEAE